VVDLAHFPRVKVCGITVFEDVEPAFAHGLDAVGFVRWPGSPRCLSDAAARELADALPPGVLRVEVLVDATPEQVSPWASAVQLCGGEAPERWFDFRLPILRRIPVEPGAEIVIESWSGVAAGFVLDHPSGPGGTGAAVDLELARALARRAPCLLAGGLDETNVAARVRAVRPGGVDASSRLESKPGRKIGARVAAFVRAARAALEESP
jgi:phosphoribosylanthranilate isomerase